MPAVFFEVKGVEVVVVLDALGGLGVASKYNKHVFPLHHAVPTPHAGPALDGERIPLVGGEVQAPQIPIVVDLQGREEGVRSYRPGVGGGSMGRPLTLVEGRHDSATWGAPALAPRRGLESLWRGEHAPKDEEAVPKCRRLRSSAV
jgi:hypothetical protein